jgi:hypothetical protein
MIYTQDYLNLLIHNKKISKEELKYSSLLSNVSVYLNDVKNLL